MKASEIENKTGPYTDFHSMEKNVLKKTEKKLYRFVKNDCSFNFWVNYKPISVSQSYLFFFCGTEIIDGSCEKQRSHTGFKVEGCRSPVGSLGRWCVMVVLVPQCPLSAALRAQLLGHAASICLQRWGATHHQHSQSITPRVKSKLSSSTRALRA